MTKVKIRSLSLTDGRFPSLTPLKDFRGEPDIAYRDNISGEKFAYPVAELIAAGYDTVPDYLTVDAVYILRPIKLPSQM